MESLLSNAESDPNPFPEIKFTAREILHAVFHGAKPHTPLHLSDHYDRTHFTDEPVQPPQGLPPAERWE